MFGLVIRLHAVLTVFKRGLQTFYPGFAHMSLSTEMNGNLNTYFLSDSKIANPIFDAGTAYIGYYRLTATQRRGRPARKMAYRNRY